MTLTENLAQKKSLAPEQQATQDLIRKILSDPSAFRGHHFKLEKYRLTYVDNDKSDTGETGHSLISALTTTRQFGLIAHTLDAIRTILDTRYPTASRERREQLVDHAVNFDKWDKHALGLLKNKNYTGSPVAFTTKEKEGMDDIRFNFLGKRRFIKYNHYEYESIEPLPSEKYRDLTDERNPAFDKLPNVPVQQMLFKNFTPDGR